MSNPARVAPFVRIFSRYLRDRGLPVTQQREAIAQVIFSSEEHLSVEEIERRLRDRGERIGKATVYRTLDLLVKSKLVAEHDFGEGFKRYEHRLSAEPEHEHLICLGCGDVQEFQSRELTRIEQSLQAEFGFRPTRHRLEIYGVCAECHQAGVELPNEGLTCPVDAL
ncbi:MAG: Fur family transcriptional regulator [Gemmatimonadota bacterium]|nr:transcriptional repressor [Gemmatimonadota bacterium]